ncbi:hypothetical protein [Haloparvum sedimenti]|uniref:hypothetical protein n=1 Tax=Haloparvum sedimenti TaxID=1678448 RepID=UPI00071E87A7|nr:hypothetical protein [Haloparvum sedimenti]
MVQVESSRNELRVVDAEGRSTTVEGRFEPAGNAPGFDRAVGGRTTVTARRLRLDGTLVTVENLDDGGRRELASDPAPVNLDAAAYRVRIAAPVRTVLRFDGAVTVAKPAVDAVVLTFPAATPVSVGFRTGTRRARASVTVPSTPSGVATALTAMATSHRTASPDRSRPEMRTQPPTVTFGEGQSIPPSALDSSLSGPRPEVVVQPELSALLQIAPLAHYVGARVETEPDAAPVLRAGREWSLTDGSGGLTAAAALRRVFHLDCLVRNAGPRGTDLAETRLLDRLDLDPVGTYPLPVAERVDRYMAADYGAIASDLPDWHLSMYLRPDYESVRTLPYLLSNVPQVFAPEAEPLPDAEWLKRSLDDFVRGRDSVSVDLSKPSLGSGRTHGWLADSAPIDVFKALPEAYENRARYRNRSGESVSVVAVVNDPEMSTEGDAAVEVYRKRAAELDVDVTVREQVTTGELAALFESPHDLVHFIGHCEPAGFVCPDGHFAAAELDESNAQTFFLNACGSYYEGLDLIRRGSVAGGVTFNRVLDGNAALVGTAFARLLMHGFAFERALSLARRRVMTGKDYVVVGDGTHALTRRGDEVPAVLEVEPADGGYRVVHDAYTPGAHGGVYRPHLQSDGVSQLCGMRREFLVDAPRLRELLSIEVMPVLYGGDLRWSSELAETL